MKILLENVSENREEWLKIKQETVGSSEISTIVGLNAWETPLSLWMKKTGRIPAAEDNDSMRLGRLMESFIGEKFARDMNFEVSPANVLLAHDIHEKFTASPDFWVRASNVVVNGGSIPCFDSLLECKNVNYRGARQWEDMGCPDHAQIQLQWQLAITGLSGGYVAGLVGANVKEAHYREFQADAQIAETLFEAANAFMECVKSDTPPAATAQDRELIERSLNPGKTIIELPDTMNALLLQYEHVLLQRKDAEATVKAYKKEEDGIRVQLEQFIGDAGIGKLGAWEVILNRINKGAYEVKPSSYITMTVKKDGVKL